MFFRCSGSAPQAAMYEFTCADGGTTLVLNVRAELWPGVLQYLEQAPVVSWLQKDLRIPPFILPRGLPWGFGPVFAKAEKALGTWWSVRCELPQFFRHKDPQQGDPWSRAFGLSASLSLLLECINRVADERDLPSHPAQCVEVILSARRDSYGSSCGISAAFSPQVCSWIRKHDPAWLKSVVTEKMRNAYLRLYGLKELDSIDSFRLALTVRELPYLTFDCPGDRCSLYPDSRFAWEEGSGYELGDHNVDTPMQQLTLLTGVAALTTAFRIS